MEQFVSDGWRRDHRKAHQRFLEGRLVIYLPDPKLKAIRAAEFEQALAARGAAAKEAFERRHPPRVSHAR